jgi:choice-of-anchor C domain-containing protein
MNPMGDLSMGKIHAMTVASLVAVALVAGVVTRHSTAGSRAAPAKDEKNLIVNGSFEDGPKLEANFLPVDEDSVEIRGWAVTRGQIDLLQESGGQQKAARGKRSLDLHGSPGFGGVEQAFATKAGQKYKVTFCMSGNPGLEYRSVQMAVRAAGKKEVFEFDMTGVTLDDLKWETKAWEFTAVNAITILEFQTAMMKAHPFGGPLLDDVKVVAAD